MPVRQLRLNSRLKWVLNCIDSARPGRAPAVYSDSESDSALSNSAAVSAALSRCPARSSWVRRALTGDTLRLNSHQSVSRETGCDCQWADPPEVAAVASELGGDGFAVLNHSTVTVNLTPGLPVLVTTCHD